jgi:uroporphyrinogen decarboxylase
VDRADRFLGALRRQPVDTTPVWYMRQAGRYQPAYRALRERHDLLGLVRRPDLAARVTVAPVRELGVDAAILFSDIMVPLAPAGIDFAIREGVGPVVADPIRRPRDVDRVRAVNPAVDLPYVIETVGLAAQALDGVPLIGFAGGPFTLASYLVEGGPSRHYARVKGMMWSEEAAWHRLMERLTEIAVALLRAEAAAGARAVQVFDSWIGQLAPADFNRYVRPHVTRLMHGLADLGVPRIYFAVGAGELLEQMAASGPEAVGVDWRVPLGRAFARLPGLAVQGNLDPCAVLLAPAAMLAQADAVLHEAAGQLGHVFNLGHGVLPDTPPDHLRRLTDHVHAAGLQSGAAIATPSPPKEARHAED